LKIKTKLMNTEDPIFLPYRKHEDDAGADLRARINGTFALSPGEIFKIPTGVAIEIPNGYVGMIQPRSGASSEGKVAITGTIDSSFRGEMSINIINLARYQVTIQPGERLAQIIIIPCLVTEFEQVEELSESERGENGFGSTGKY
jgi:dUTP pyrophosphatase